MTRLRNIVIPSHSFGQSVAFYRDLLGLKVQFEGNKYCYFKASEDTFLAIHQIENASEFMPTGHGMYLDVEVDKLEDVLQRFRDSGIAIRKVWIDNINRFALIADPDGNLIEMIEIANHSSGP